MYNDNVYMNSTESFSPFSEPKAQKEARTRTVEETLEAVPLLKEVAKHLDDQIAFYSSVDSITVDIDKDPATFQKVHAANKLTRDNLAREKEFIISRIKDAHR